MIEDYKNKLLGFYRKNKRMPVYSEMLPLFGFASKNAAHKLVSKFIELGVVEKDSSGKLIPKNIFGETPLLGTVTAGFPVAAEEQNLDSLNLDDFLIEKKDSTYLLEVDGDSMIDAHIADGDMVIAEKSNKAKDGDIVIAEVDGEWTMKYFRTKGNKVWLEPANKKYQPIHPEHSFSIAAVVKGVVRKF
ncbi:MAG: transcriptional repressor LexA [Patescibacteria group bacterium]